MNSNNDNNKKYANVASQTFNRVLGRITDDPETVSFNIYGRGIFGLGSSARGVLISTEENREWAQVLQQQFLTEFESIYRDIKLEIEPIFLKPNNLLLQSALLSHPFFRGRDKERYSFVITPGYTEAELINELRQALGLSAVQVYCLQGPIESSPIKPKEGVAGVHNTPMEGSEYAACLRGAVPTIKKVCIAYSPYIENLQEREMLRQHRNLIKAAFKEFPIEVVEHSWDFEEAYASELQTTLADCDVLITLDEPAVSKHADTVLKICEATQTLLCSSDLDLVVKGAGFGCGVAKSSYIKPMIKLLRALLARNGFVKSCQIPMQSGMRYNLRGIKNQGVKLSSIVLALLRAKDAHELDAVSILETE